MSRTVYDFLTRPPTGTPGRTISPSEGLQFSIPLLEGVAETALHCAHRMICMLPPSLLFSLQGWGLTDLPLRASNEGSPRPRVARAKKIIRLHPLLYSASRRMVACPRASFGACAFRSCPASHRQRARDVSDCAHRTSTVSPCAFCEQEGHLAPPSPSF